MNFRGVNGVEIGLWGFLDVMGHRFGRLDDRFSRFGSDFGRLLPALVV
ncbi:hypothetical protein [Sporosarcina sp. 6E9]|nr:hypothetical protein [Sporosarcina sp. 6E9]